jgi:hypothetical protein
MKKQINEFKRMQLIAGLITESEYRQSMNEVKETISVSDAKEYADSWDDDDISMDFKKTFSGKDQIAKSDFINFFKKHIDDMSEMSDIRSAWDQLLSGEGLYEAERKSLNEEETIFADYSTNNNNSIKTKLARNLAEEIHSFDAKEGTIESLFTGEMKQYEEGNDDFYANKEEALKAFAELPDTFSIIHNIDGDKVKISITKTGPKSWKVN